MNFKPLLLLLAIGIAGLLTLNHLNLQAKTHPPTSLTLPTVISHHMVLQQQAEVAIWGWDRPDTTLTVDFRGRQKTTQAGLDGKWVVRIPSGAAGGPFSLTVQGSQTITLEDVLVGEVWVAGGQSNMWWSVQNSQNGAPTIATANHPFLRIWDANTAPRSVGWQAAVPQRTVPAEWKPTTPQTVGAFPATPYFFAQNLQQTLNVPIGILHLAVPGREIEAFLSQEFMAANFPQTIELQQMPAAAVAATPNRASELFNGMVYPAAPYTARGFIWWQGESNAERSPLQYRVLFPGLIQEWRHLWQQENAPFLYVELANFLPPQRYPVEDNAWPALRDAQKTALRLPQTAMISTIDILGAAEDVNDGHPRNKQLAGDRLALAALAQVYGKDLIWSGPAYKTAEFKGNQAIVTFDFVGAGLVTKDGTALRGFALAGADQRFFWAEATIQANTVVLTSSSVQQPVAVRYNWANNPIGNLYNSAGLPAFPFRSDTWILGVKALQLQEMDWQTLASYIDRSLPFPTATQQEWQQVYRSLSNNLGNDLGNNLSKNQRKQSSLLIEQILQQSIEEETLDQALHILLSKLNPQG